jgi:hypothetical protein
MERSSPTFARVGARFCSHLLAAEAWRVGTRQVCNDSPLRGMRLQSLSGRIPIAIREADGCLGRLAQAHAVGWIRVTSKQASALRVDRGGAANNPTSPFLAERFPGEREAGKVISTLPLGATRSLASVLRSTLPVCRAAETRPCTDGAALPQRKCGNLFRGACAPRRYTLLPIRIHAATRARAVVQGCDRHANPPPLGGPGGNG